MKTSVRFLFVLSALFVLGGTAPALAQGGWEELQSGTTASLQALDFSETGIGTVVGLGSTILRTIDSGDNWTVQTGEPEVDYYGVAFADVQTGVICGNSGTILLTQNGGAVWTTRQTGWTSTYIAAHMVSSTTGIIVGQGGIFNPIGALTTNGWQSWTDFTYYPTHNDVMYEGAARDVVLLDPNHLITVNAIWDGQGAITRSVNGGQTWNTVHWNQNSLVALSFPTSAVGYAVGGAGTIVKTEDGGANWTSLGQFGGVLLYGVAFVNPDTGWAVGESGTILRTNNGGEDWTAQDSPVPSHLYSVEFMDANVGYICGENGVILRTATGGEPPSFPPDPFTQLFPLDSAEFCVNYEPPTFQWTHSFDPYGGSITYLLQISWRDTSATFITEDTVLTVTANGFFYYLPMNDYAPAVWRVYAMNNTDTLAATGNDSLILVAVCGAADDPEPGVIRDYQISAFPNPFNPSTNLSLTLPQTGPVTVRIVDLLGREVFTQNLGVLSVGRHTLSFDGSQLATGVYLATLESGAIRRHQKLLLLR